MNYVKITAKCTEQEFKDICQRKGATKECTGDQFVDWCKNSQSINVRTMCNEYCKDVTFENFDGYCQVIDYCKSINVEMNVSKCTEDCIKTTNDNQYLINTCNSFSFNQICFDNCIDKNNDQWCQACNTSCLFPESLAESITNYTYCQILPEYKQISPCKDGIDNIDCTPRAPVSILSK